MGETILIRIVIMIRATNIMRILVTLIGREMANCNTTVHIYIEYKIFGGGGGGEREQGEREEGGGGGSSRSSGASWRPQYFSTAVVLRRRWRLRCRKMRVRLLITSATDMSSYSPHGQL